MDVHPPLKVVEVGQDQIFFPPHQPKSTLPKINATVKTPIFLNDVFERESTKNAKDPLKSTPPVVDMPQPPTVVDMTQPLPVVDMTQPQTGTITSTDAKTIDSTDGDTQAQQNSVVTSTITDSTISNIPPSHPGSVDQQINTPVSDNSQAAPPTPSSLKDPKYTAKVQSNL